MATWTAEVFEVRVYKVKYVVEADDQDDACDKCIFGETISEEEVSFEEVQSRELHRLPERNREDVSDVQ